MEIINIEFKTNMERTIKYLNQVPLDLKFEMDNKIPRLRRDTKKVIQNKAPVNRGMYRKSFTINNYSRSKWEIGYEVYAKPPHYRLTHLLEGRDDLHPHYAHILKQFRWGQGERTRKGNVGMVRHGETKRYLHLKPGYEFAYKRMIDLCEEALDKVIR